MRYLVLIVLTILAFIIVSPAVKSAGVYLMNSWKKLISKENPSHDEHENNTL